MKICDMIIAGRKKTDCLYNPYKVISIFYFIYIYIDIDDMLGINCA